MAAKGRSIPRLCDGIGAMWVRVLAHGVGTLGTALLLLWLVADEASRQAFLAACENPQFRAFVAPDLLIHLGLSLGLWVSAVLVFVMLRRQLERGGKPSRIKLAGNRLGTVMTETLVALPVLLMLIFGIAQLCLNNMAGIVTNLATFQAARSAWLWESEPCRSIECDAAERARIQAAAVLTPVAPGALYVGSDAMTPAAKQMRGTLLGAQHPDVTTDSGERGMQMADNIISGNRTQQGSLADAVDVSTFSARTARKFTFAYHATSVEIFNPGQNLIRVVVTYRHHCAVPMVGAIFGKPGRVAGRSGYYTHIERVFELNRLPEPNREAVVGPDSRRLY